jgi:phosphoglycolate phosphatase
VAPGGARRAFVRRPARRGAGQLSRGAAARHPAEVVLFDLDGVLADSRLAITSCMNHALVEAGRVPVAPEALYPLIGPSLAYGFASLLAVAPDDPAVASCIASYRSVYAEVSVRDTPAYPGVPEALDAIAAAAPGRRLAVATSKPRAFAEPLLEALGLRDRFAHIAAPELDLHVESKTATVAAALAALGAATGTGAMVGDRHVDMAAAHAHGLRAVGATWGFGTEAELREAGADVLVGAPAGLPAAV